MLLTALVTTAAREFCAARMAAAEAASTAMRFIC
jgi:hypothetical protein